MLFFPAVLIVVGLLYAQRKLRLSATQDAAEVVRIRRRNRERALELAIAGGFDPAHPERGGGITELAHGDGATRRLAEDGVPPATIFGLSQTEDRAKALEQKAEAKVAWANRIVAALIGGGLAATIRYLTK